MNNEEILTPQEAADLLKISVNTVYHLKSCGKIPFRKIGGSLRFMRSELLNWVTSGASA